MYLRIKQRILIWGYTVRIFPDVIFSWRLTLITGGCRIPTSWTSPKTSFPSWPVRNEGTITRFVKVVTTDISSRNFASRQVGGTFACPGTITPTHAHVFVREDYWSCVVKIGQVKHVYTIIKTKFELMLYVHNYTTVLIHWNIWIWNIHARILCNLAVRMRTTHINVNAFKMWNVCSVLVTKQQHYI